MSAKKLLGMLPPGIQATRPATQWVDNPGIPATQPGSTGYPGLPTDIQGIQDTQTTQSKPKWKDTRQQLNLKISGHKLELFKAWCAERGLGQKEAIEMAIENLMGTSGTQTTQISTVTGYRFEDVDSGNISIIVQTLFEDITGKHMSAEDIEAFNDIQRLDSHVIVAGMLLTALRAKQQINSFRYFHGGIREVNEVSKMGVNIRNRYRDLLYKYQRKKGR